MASKFNGNYYRYICINTLYTTPSRHIVLALYAAYSQLDDLAYPPQYPTTPLAIALLVSSLSHQDFYKGSLYRDIAGEAQFLGASRGSWLDSCRVNWAAILSLQNYACFYHCIKPSMCFFLIYERRYYFVEKQSLLCHLQWLHRWMEVDYLEVAQYKH